MILRWDGLKDDLVIPVIWACLICISQLAFGEWNVRTPFQGQISSASTRSISILCYHNSFHITSHLWLTHNGQHNGYHDDDTQYSKYSTIIIIVVIFVISVVIIIISSITSIICSIISIIILGVISIIIIITLIVLLLHCDIIYHIYHGRVLYDVTFGTISEEKYCLGLK